MYRIPVIKKSKIKGFQTSEGETIEMKVDRIINNGDPITDGAKLIYTEKKDGVQAQYNIRTDMMEVAMEALDKSNRSRWTKHQEALEATKNKLAEDAKNEDKGGEQSQ